MAGRPSRDPFDPGIQFDIGSYQQNPDPTSHIGADHDKQLAPPQQRFDASSASQLPPFNQKMNLRDEQPSQRPQSLSGPKSFRIHQFLTPAGKLLFQLPGELDGGNQHNLYETSPDIYSASIRPGFGTNRDTPSDSNSLRASRSLRQQEASDHSFQAGFAGGTQNMLSEQTFPNTYSESTRAKSDRIRDLRSPLNSIPQQQAPNPTFQASSSDANQLAPLGQTSSSSSAIHNGHIATGRKRRKIQGQLSVRRKIGRDGVQRLIIDDVDSFDKPVLKRTQNGDFIITLEKRAQSFQFLDLPRELRNMIYREVIGIRRKLHIDRDWRGQGPLAVAKFVGGKHKERMLVGPMVDASGLLAVPNRQLHCEITEEFFKRQRFCCDDMPRLSRFLGHCEHLLENVYHLHIDWYKPEKGEERVDKARLARHLINCNKLRTLRIEFRGVDYNPITDPKAFIRNYPHIEDLLQIRGLKRLDMADEFEGHIPGMLGVDAEIVDYFRSFMYLPRPKSAEQSQ